VFSIHEGGRRTIIDPQITPEAVVWVAVGGRGTLVGPIVGAISVNALKSWASREYPAHCILLMGLGFVLVVLFLPKGLVGLWETILSYWKNRKGEKAS